MHEAELYSTETDKSIKCALCMHRCHILPGKRGLCGVRENNNGKLYSLVYGKVVAEHADPIEKKPLFHFLPGSRSYSIATVGCNMRCLHCQNQEISQYPHLYNGAIAGTYCEPEAIVEKAISAGCASISYTYVEPTIFYEFARKTAILGQSRGLKNIFVSNGFMTPEACRELAVVLDGINIDLKAFTDAFYKKTCKARLQPVLDIIALMHELGVWVEVTTLIIPGANDSREELRDIARFIAGISVDIPWHVTAFHPAYLMTDRPSTPLATLRRAWETGLAEGLHHVYLGNVPGSGGENTRCSACGSTQILRAGFLVCENRLHEGCCSNCGKTVAGVWE